MPPLTVLSFGGGQDSTAILYKIAYDDAFRSRYVEGDLLVVMADTGDEHEETLAHVEAVKDFCSAQSIEFVHITPDLGHHTSKWQSLRAFWDRTKTIGSKAFPKTCTDKLKIVPIYNFLDTWLGERYGYQTGRKRAIKEFAQQHGRIRVLLGIAAGEETRVADISKEPKRWMRESTERFYPLIDIGYDRAACIAYIESLNHSVPPPSNCMLCPFMSEVELVWLYRHKPADYQDWVRLERQKLDNNRHLDESGRNLGVWGKRTLPDVLDAALGKYGHWSKAQLQEYKMSHGHCVKSKY